MIAKKIDLHVHSTYSDGTFTPSELVHEAERAGLSAIALTDHDTTAGIPEAIQAAAGTSLEIIPGVELSTEYSGQEIHVVGLFITPDHPELTAALSKFQNARNQRNEKMLELLRKEGFSITMESLVQENPDAVITRANIARYLVDHNQIGSINHVFEKYLGDDCPCYVAREKISPMEACRLIHAAGGLSVLAHPVLYHMKPAELNKLIEEMKPAGLAGIEAIYSTYDRGDEIFIKKTAEENGLLISGGSDFHGSNKPYIHLGTGRGNLFIPYSILEKMKQHLH